MNALAGPFLTAAVVSDVAGLTLGVHMGASHQLALMSAHSHLSLLGWVTLAVSALYCQVVPGTAERPLAKVHFRTANIVRILRALSLVLKPPGVAAA